METHPYLLTVAEVPGGEVRVNEVMLRAYLTEAIDVDEGDIDAFITKIKAEGLVEQDVTITYSARRRRGGMSKVPKLVQGVDYYIDPLTKKFVLTEDYLRRRGTCCKSGCRHCPYGFQKKGKT